MTPLLRTLLVSILLSMAGCGSPGSARIAFREAFPHLTFERPVWLCQAPAGDTRWYLVSQVGMIYTFPDEAAANAPTPFLDIAKRIHMGHNEEGLLAFSFHPNFVENHKFYVYYSVDAPRRTRLSEFRATDPAKADPASERVLLEVEQPYGNHKGGTILFGPDGYLYLSLGDGGAGGDPHDAGQRLDTLLGKILRLDVDRVGGAAPYAIPDSNPFRGSASARPEIWAYGLRNVWRMSFDRETGELWAADVGQNEWEEVDLVVKGGNYGWRVREGKHRFDPTKADPAAKFVEPVIEYGRSLGGCVTGGYVYRGKRRADLAGTYVYGDFMTGTVWGLRRKGDQVENEVLLHQPKNIASFAEGRDGELFALCFDGKIYRIE